MCGSGVPPEPNESFWAPMRQRLARSSIKPAPSWIAWSKAAHLDLLRIRASTRLFRLRSAQEVMQRLSFPNTGPTQNPAVLVGHLNGRGLPGAQYEALMYFINTDASPVRVGIPGAEQHRWVLHPVHLSPEAADTRIKASARFDPQEGAFLIPTRSAVVFVTP